MTTQSEQSLENDLVQQLADQGYEKVAIAKNICTSSYNVAYRRTYHQEILKIV